MSALEAIPTGTPGPLELARKELSDLGNAERLIARNQGRLLYVEDRGWLAYDDKHWSAEQGRMIAMRAAHDVARMMREEAFALAEAIKKDDVPKGLTAKMLQDRLEALRKWSVVSGNANKSSAMLAQAESLVPASREQFDTDPLAVNCQNGTLRAVRGEDGRWAMRLDPHEPTNLISRIVTVDYDPDAPCPRWEAHLATVLPDPDVRAFFQTIVGYALTGLISEQCVFLLQGRGGDGKSTTMNVLRALWGQYAAAADVQTFMAGAMRSGADASPDLARLAGDVRLCSTGEPRRGGALDEAKIKAITGGSPITARQLHGEPFEYLPRFKLFLECNAKPRISGDDDGIWRRIVVIMFPHQFDERKGQAPNKRILEELMTEGSGILNWAIAGMLRWLDAGQLVLPAQVRDAVEDYRRAANPFGEWFHERVDTRDQTALTLAADLYADYKDWCEANAIVDREIMSSTAFGRALGDRQILKGPKDGRGMVRRRGASLRSKDGTVDPPAPYDDDGRWGPPPTEIEGMEP